MKAGHWLTHLEQDWNSPVWRHWLTSLSEDHTVVRYDERGSGLSDRDVPTLSFDGWVADLEAVIDAAHVDRFTLMGLSQGGPIAIAYAAKHPERVNRLVLYGAYARRRLRRAPNQEEVAEAHALITLTRAGWGRDNPAFRRLFTTLFIPGANHTQLAWLDDLQRVSCSAEHAARTRSERYSTDVTELAATIAVPTLVMHARQDALVPFDEGRRLAALIPDARFVPLDSANHILLADEPAWEDFRAELRAFTGTASQTGIVQRLGLTRREQQILALVAEGRSNDAIAAALHLSVRTVERHLSNCYSKLELTGKAARAAAALFVMQQGVDPQV